MPSNAKEYQKEYIRKHYQSNKDYYKEKSREYKKNLSVERRLFLGARQRAKKNNIDFCIEESDIIIPEKCPVFKTPFDQKDVYSRASIDRIDPKLGYIKGNIQIISYRANWLKSNATLSEIEKIYFFMKLS